MIQYRGKCSEEYARALDRCSAPCTIIMTIRKLRTTMPSLKPPVEKMIRSGIVYKITCPRCTACYVGQSSRHLQTRIREHTKNPGPVKTHLRNCNTTITEEHIIALFAACASKCVCASTRILAHALVSGDTCPLSSAA